MAYKEKQTDCLADAFLSALDFEPAQEAAQRGAFKPSFRFVAILAAHGYLPSEIAVKMGYDESEVNRILKMPQVEEMLKNEIEDLGKDAMKLRFMRELDNSVSALVDVRDSVATPPAVKRQAAKDLIEFGRGKATQYVDKPDKPDRDKANATNAKIDEQLEELRRQKENLYQRLGERYNAGSN